MSRYVLDAGALVAMERGDRRAFAIEVTITRHGRAVAVVVRPDTPRSRRATAA